VRSDLESFEASDEALSSTRSEQVWCFIKVNKEKILVGCVYRPPLAESGVNLEISKSIGYASRLCKTDSSKHLLVAGDFNFPDIKWNQEGGFCTNKGRPSSLEFLNTLSKNFLTQHVLEPTFKSNTLDLVITDDPSRIFSITHGPPLGSTDKDRLHATLSWNFGLRTHLSASAEATPRPVYQQAHSRQCQAPRQRGGHSLQPVPIVLQHCLRPGHTNSRAPSNEPS